MKDRLREFFVIVVKGVVSAVVAWLAAQGIDVTPEVVTALEVGLAGLAFGVTNWALNAIAVWARRIPRAGVLVDLVWPTPHYDRAELKAV